MRRLKPTRRLTREWLAALTPSEQARMGVLGEWLRGRGHKQSANDIEVAKRGGKGESLLRRDSTGAPATKV